MHIYSLPQSMYNRLAGGLRQCSLHEVLLGSPPPSELKACSKQGAHTPGASVGHQE